MLVLHINMSQRAAVFVDLIHCVYWLSNRAPLYSLPRANDASMGNLYKLTICKLVVLADGAGPCFLAVLEVQG